MRILNLGSINIDHVYAVDHFVRPGETLASSRYEIFAGGKGFNQSIALARAGAATRHAGRVGKDAAWLLDRLTREGVDIFILNETEAEGLTGKTEPNDVRVAMGGQFPRAATVLTLGCQGAVYFGPDALLRQPGIAVKAADTTAAGDTFVGYFLAELMQSGDPEKALSLGCLAAAICVTRPGASDSIPRRKELETFQPGQNNGCEAPRR